MALTPAYTREFTTACDTTITADAAVSAFSNGTLARLVTNDMAPQSATEERRLTTAFDTIDRFIREHPPEWTASSFRRLYLLLHWSNEALLLCYVQPLST
jgi:hypothetical protein